MSDNNNGELKKKCPFLKEWCLGDSCACYVIITQTKVGQLGLAQQVQSGMCSFPALCMIMSTANKQPIKPPPFRFSKG